MKLSKKESKVLTGEIDYSGYKNTKIKPDVVNRLARKGKTAKEIHEITGYSLSGIYDCAQRHRIEVKQKQASVERAKELLKDGFHPIKAARMADISECHSYKLCRDLNISY